MSAAARASSDPVVREKFEAEAMKTLKKLGFPATEDLAGPSLHKVTACLTRRLVVLTDLIKNLEKSSTPSAPSATDSKESKKLSICEKHPGV